MCCDRLNTRPVSTVVAVLLSGGLVGRHRGPQVVTSIVFDDETRSIRSADVVYTEQVNCNLLILLQGTRTRTVRAQLTQQGRLVVRRQVCAMAQCGICSRFRPREGYRDQGRRHRSSLSGRVVRNRQCGESQQHMFKIRPNARHIMMRGARGMPIGGPVGTTRRAGSPETVVNGNVVEDHHGHALGILARATAPSRPRQVAIATLYAQELTWHRAFALFSLSGALRANMPAAQVDSSGQTTDETTWLLVTRCI